MDYESFECTVGIESFADLAEPFWNKEYNKEIQDYIKKHEAKKLILQVRNRFKEALLKHQGPSIIPTIFKNHPHRYEYVRCRDRYFHYKRNVQNPPELPLYLFTCADDIFLNLTCNLRNGAYRMYISHGVKARFISMNQGSCGEMAFEEMLSERPLFYSGDEAIVNLSQYVVSGRQSPPDTQSQNVDVCSNIIQYIVDFSIILPEMKVSTVWVYCIDCGRLVETVLYDKTVRVVVEEILHNVSQTQIEQLYRDTDSIRKVIRLPVRSSSVYGCTHVEGLMGVTPLTKGNPLKPSVFVRTRLFYFCSPDTNISDAVHCSAEKDISNPEIINSLTQRLEKM